MHLLLIPLPSHKIVIYNLIYNIIVGPEKGTFGHFYEAIIHATLMASYMLIFGFLVSDLHNLKTKRKACNHFMQHPILVPYLKILIRANFKKIKNLSDFVSFHYYLSHILK